MRIFYTKSTVLRYLIGILLLIFGVLFWMYFWVGVPSVVPNDMPEPPALHFYGDTGRPLGEIMVYAVYFVPENKKALIAENWRGLLETNLAKLRAFHSVQFGGRSQTQYRIYPDPVVGMSESTAYDTDDTANGNPRALITIAQELEKRVFNSSGDRFRSDFAGRPIDAYPVMMVLYEGVGASGGMIFESESESAGEIANKLGLSESVVFPIDIKAVDGFFLMNREFLTGSYGPFGASLLAHEFYHTIGLPDQYDIPGGTPLSPDLMGSGRFLPIEKTHLGRDLLRQLGLYQTR